MRGHIRKRGKNSYSLTISLGKDVSTGKYKQQWVSVQIRGNAEVIESKDSRFEGLVAKYKPARMTPLRASLRFDLIMITPERIIYFDTNLMGNKAGIYQQWERKKWSN